MQPGNRGFFPTREDMKRPQPYEQAVYYDPTVYPLMQAYPQQPYLYQPPQFSSPSFYPAMYVPYRKQESPPKFGSYSQQYYPPGFPQTNAFKGPNPNAASFVPMGMNPSPPVQPAAPKVPTREDQQAAKFGVRSILSLNKSVDSDHSMMIKGQDLSLLGVDMGDSQLVSPKIGSLFDNSELGPNEQPEISLPPCYFISKPILRVKLISLFSTMTLFYIFYNMPGEMLQAYAAEELYRKEWKFDKRQKLWYMFSNNSWKKFNVDLWEIVSCELPALTEFLTKDEIRRKKL